MNTNDFTYGEPFLVATRLNTENKVTVQMLTKALMNALIRIGTLEREVENLRTQLTRSRKGD